MLLDNKIALITGAASGIGAATARLFVEEGATVILADINRDELQNLASELGESAQHLAGDITEEDYVKSLVEMAVTRYGRLDCAVNNAGISGNPSALADMKLANWRRMLDINLTSVFLCLKYQLQQMSQQCNGAIVNISSGAGVIAVPFMADYCAAKHGVLGLTKTAAAEMAKQGVRVNAILPGSIHTPMLQSTMSMSPEVEKMVRASAACGRLGAPEEIAQNCAWLCSDRSSYVSGASVPVDYASICR